MWVGASMSERGACLAILGPDAVDREVPTLAFVAYRAMVSLSGFRSLNGLHKKEAARFGYLMLHNHFRDAIYNLTVARGGDGF